MYRAVSHSFEFMVPHGKLGECIQFLEEGLSALRKTRFHEVIGRDFLHQTDAAAAYMIDFHREASTKIRVGALYFEMNGFAINPDKWYFDGFAYMAAGDIWALEWLAHWNAETNQHFTLTGMEFVQEAFAEIYWDEARPLSIEIAEELADCLVTARFMQLIGAAHQPAKRRYRPLDGLPILATAHDRDTVHQTQ